METHKHKVLYNLQFYQKPMVLIKLILILTILTAASKQVHADTNANTTAEVESRKPQLLTGQVIDAENGLPIIGAAIKKKNNTGVITDIDGNFSIELEHVPTTIEVIYMGYKKEIIRIKKTTKNLVIKLNINVIAMDEVEIYAKRRFSKDQYTWYLHNKIAVHSNENNPDNFTPIDYSNYERMSIYSIKEDKKTSGKTKSTPFMMNEQLSYHHRASDIKNEISEIISTQDNLLFEDGGAYVKRALEEKVIVDINFYESQIEILERGFISPLASNASINYRMYLTDSTGIGDTKRYTFHFFPKTKKHIAFKGSFEVDSTTWALTKIDAEVPNSANLNFVSNLRVNTEYQKTSNKQWFQKKQEMTMNMSLINKNDTLNKHNIFLFKLRKINSFELIDSFDRELPKITTTQNNRARRKVIQASDDSLLTTQRIKVPMDSIEQKANDELNRIKKKPINIFIDRFLKMAITSYLNLGPIDVGPYYDIYRRSMIEGHRFALPLRTSEKLCPFFNVGGYASYRTATEDFGYSAYMNYRIPTKNRFIVNLNFTDDYFGLTENKFIKFIQENPYSSGTGNIVSIITPISANPYMIQKTKASITAEYEINENLGVMIRPSYERYSANREYDHYTPHVLFTRGGGSESFDYFDAQTLMFNLRISHDQSYDDTFFDRVYYGNGMPVYNISLYAGRFNMQNEKKGNYFANLNLSVKLRKSIGQLKLVGVLECGAIFGDVPYPLLDLPMGSGDLGSARYHYNLLDHASYASDIYAKLHLTLNAGGFIFNYIPYVNRLNLREIFGFKAYYGALLGNHNKILDMPDYLHSPGKYPYMEFSAGIANIFKCLRIEYVGSLDRAAVKKGIAFRHGLRMRFEVSF